MIGLASGNVYGAASSAASGTTPREYTFINDTDETFHIRIRAESNQAVGGSRQTAIRVVAPLQQNKAVNQEVFKFAPRTAFKVTLNSPGTLRLTGWPATVRPALDIDSNGKPTEISKANKDASIFSVIPPYQSSTKSVYSISPYRAPLATALLPSSYYLQFKKSDSNEERQDDPLTYFDVTLKEY